MIEGLGTGLKEEKPGPAENKPSQCHRLIYAGRIHEL